MHNTPDPLTTDKAEIYLEGLRIAVQTGKISCATLQRKMRVGYITAVNVVEWLKEQGYEFKVFD